MNQVKSIAIHFRLIFTALTLLCALALNNRELTTYALPAVPGQEQSVQNKAQQQTEIKQKVSFEATPSYVVLQLDQFVSEEPVTLTSPIACLLPVIDKPVSAITGFFSRFILSQITPNAP